MKKLSNWIVDHKIVLFAIFGALLIASCALLPSMIKKVNYDFTSYLPAGFDTYDGYEFLKENFHIHGDVELGVTLPENYDVQALVAEITKIDGVTQVIWAGTMDGLEDMLPNSGIDVTTIADLFKDGNRYTMLASLAYPPSSAEALDVFQQIEKLIKAAAEDGNYYMAGMTYQANALFEGTFNEIWKYILIAAVVVIIILLFTMDSFIEPLILLLTMVISILINLGTNAFFKSTSLVTFACSAILQLGLSIDYAIFMLHSYRDELKRVQSPEQAMKRAIPKTAVAIAASALTTLGGMLALLAMKFTIGSDLGIVLAKGIVTSFLTVLFIQPCFMLVLEKARKKTMHKALNFKLRAGVKGSIKWAPVIAIAALLILVPSFIGQNNLQYKYFKFIADQEYSGEMLELQKMTDVMANQVLIAVPVDLSSEDSILKQYEFLDALSNNPNLGEGKISFKLGMFAIVPQNVMMANYTELGGIDLPYPMTMYEALNFMMQVGEYMEPDSEFYDYYVMLKSFIGSGYTIYTVGIDDAFPVESEGAFTILKEVSRVANEIFGEDGKVYQTGMSQAAMDFALVTPTDFLVVTIVSIALVFIVLLFTLRSLKRSTLLVLLIEFGVWLNLCLQYVFTGGTVNFMSYLIIGAVQLGATVDYAILITTKYQALRKRMIPRHTAYQATTNSTMSVMTSALIMSGACFSVYFVSTNLIIQEMTFLLARGALISALLVLFVLPALLVITDSNYKLNSNMLSIKRTKKLNLLSPGRKAEIANKKANKVSKSIKF